MECELQGVMFPLHRATELFQTLYLCRKPQECESTIDIVLGHGSIMGMSSEFVLEDAI